MNNRFISSSLVALAFTFLAAGSAIADTSNTVNKVSNTIDSAGKKIEESVDKGVKSVDQFSDDSAITAKVKKAFLEDRTLSSHDISVETDKGIVTLSGFVDSTEKQTQAVKVAGEVKGVKSVNDKLNIKSATGETIKGYTDDAAITAEVKAKLLTADDVPSMSIGVETVGGIVQLTGSVDKRSQADAAESAAKQVTGVKSVKNDIKVKP